MCFSANASFGAGIVLSVIGVISLKKVQTPSQIIFASIPLIFAVQQITEGFLWLSFSNPAFSSIHIFTTYLFLFFAQVVWPVWVPLSIYKLEKNEQRKKGQKILLGIGTIVSVYLGYCLMVYNVEAKIIGYHISYEQDYPAFLSLYGGALYVISTIAPPLASSIKKMWIVGSAILISYIVTTIFYEDYIVSVWCFFASIISLLVYGMMRRIAPQK